MIVTLSLISLTCLISIIALRNFTVLERLLFWPPGVNRGQLYRFVTHGFVHADGQHLLFNMITLYFFGRAIEPFFSQYLGGAGYAGFYLGGLIVAILPGYWQHRRDTRYRSLGASGAVSAVLFAFILIQPWATLYILVIPVPAIVYAIAYTLWSIYAGRRGGDNINHSAHLWGAAYGVIFALLMEPRLFDVFLTRLLSPGLG
ncbi:rhomboid family intramembrane serine protease [Kushneria phosphatilytica]|uniref:Rhomboid family intramembrane serine protease n=1 Tax=Kushneria phosphatilytica TaxID=657387 RepID=A0A1S1NWC3_9GAMM|nr:rhomboid family intramembrane serine protease [Kushneria phosphatilytica]OHV11862.1 rhomboid family intramembrane serine protease [Kushneria phosphatilytica]QEL11036.1 rhomboid family intramembrane serine protease [Kushneria phosphatilytica]